MCMPFKIRNNADDNKSYPMKAKFSLEMDWIHQAIFVVRLQFKICQIKLRIVLIPGP